jgi:hypothetical protein
MFVRDTFKTLLAASALALMAGGASAATCNVVNFTTSTQCVSPVTGGPGGNVTETEMNAGAGVFGIKGWLELAAIGSVSAPGPQNSSPFLFSFSYNDGLKSSGTWSLNPAFTWGAGSYAFVIKGATDNAAYLMNKAFTSGSWNVVDLDLPNSGGDPDLSNVTLFGTAPLAPVPVPAAGFLLIGALGGLAAVRRRRRAV